MMRDNSDFLVDVPTDIGVITVISVSRKANRPKIPRPYEYVLPISGMYEIPKLEAMLDAYERDEKVQTAAVFWDKPVRYGIKFGVFVLSHADHVTKEGWDRMADEVQTALTSLLGPDATMYVEDWDPDHKFQMRFETYILYEELIALATKKKGKKHGDG
jgi:hypothetical protein